MEELCKNGRYHQILQEKLPYTMSKPINSVTGKNEEPASQVTAHRHSPQPQASSPEPLRRNLSGRQNLSAGTSPPRRSPPPNFGSEFYCPPPNLTWPAESLTCTADIFYQSFHPPPNMACTAKLKFHRRIKDSAVGFCHAPPNLRNPHRRIIHRRTSTAEY